jgi:hypothetical protein
MPKVNFKSYQQDPSSPTQLDIIVAKYGPYLTLEEMTDCLKIKRTIAYGLLKAKQIAHTRTSGNSGSYRIAAIDIVKYTEKHAVKAAG